MSASRRISPSERFRARVDELFNSGRELGQILAPPRQHRRQPWPGRRLRARLQREPAPALRRAHVARNVIAKVSQLDQEAVKKDYWAAGLSARLWHSLPSAISPASRCQCLRQSPSSWARGGSWSLRPCGG